MSRKRRVLVPFDIAFFLQPPYGWPIGQRSSRGPKRRPTRREAIWANTLIAMGYAVIGAGIWFGVATWHGWAGVFGGLAIAFALLFLAGFVVLLVEGIRGLRRDQRGGTKGTEKPSLE